MVAQAQVWERRLIVNWHDESLWGARKVLKVDCGQAQYKKKMLKMKEIFFPLSSVISLDLSWYFLFAQVFPQV